MNKMDAISDNRAEAVVIGGMVLDINATPSMVANPRTTTPGKVLYMLGGVARNVAECMSKLGAKPYMISAIGFDMAGSLLFQHWRSTGSSVEGIKRSEEIETAVVCNIFDGKGELAAAVASVESIEKFLTPEWIQNFKFNICSAPVLMIDANLSTPALLASCRMAAECGTPVWFEPVSVAKSKRIASIVKYTTYTSPNEDELVAMANALSSRDKFSPIHRDSSNFNFSIASLFQIIKPPTWVLLDKGIKVVIVTLGPHGVFLCFKPINGAHLCNFKRNEPFSLNEKLYEAINLNCPPNKILCGPGPNKGYNMAVHFPALSASVVRLTGGGDCLVGGTIASMCAGLDILQSVAVGIAMAKGAVESESNVPVGYELEKIADDARRVYSEAKVIFCESNL